MPKISQYPDGSPGQSTDDVIIRRAGANYRLPLSQVSGGSGWIPGTGTWSYVSADSPIFVVNAPDADAALISVGYYLKLTQTTDKFFIVHAKGSPSGGFTPLTIFGGTDYTLTSAAITSPSFSPVKALGFPRSPDKWAVTVTNSSDITFSTGTGAYQNAGSITISAPIGLWKPSISGLLAGVKAVAGVIQPAICLSTTNNSASNASLTRVATSQDSKYFAFPFDFSISYLLSIAVKTTYYLNIASINFTVDSITLFGTLSTTTIKLISAYL